MKKEALIVVALICIEKSLKKKRRRRRMWTRLWLGKRGQLGMPVLQRELETDDRSSFRSFLRMDVDQFNDLLQLVAPYISKNNTQLRQAIRVRERLSITLRSLATGESFSSLSFQYRTGRSTVGVLVKETCRVLHHVLKKDYLKTLTTEDEWREVDSGFQNKWQFPHCLGAIDGKHSHPSTKQQWEHLQELQVSFLCSPDGCGRRSLPFSVC
ncbi:uncharacterized protein LOC125886585 isoform X1 [Epinephelus fuscoguttatus]|uniref:uncharacterized protein LOC125886585 isoform X1 n=1 Tax=Epinephelus fuscoguttatus TaxID=293821 RepID=UPI0020D02CBA|nr:uncharacterized protein LOC125886585 isoform X1 [Epinephelus fuscoguttatus]